MLERIGLTGTTDGSIIDQLFDYLISIGWQNRGSQTLVGNIQTRGVANANGWVLWGVRAGWGNSRSPLYFSHLNNTGNYINNGSGLNQINFRAVGVVLPEPTGSWYSPIAYNIRLYANNTSLILVSLQVNEGGTSNDNYYFYTRFRSLIFLNWTSNNKEYVVLCNDIFCNLPPFDITPLNIITAVRQDSNVVYYYNNSRTVDNHNIPSHLPPTLFNTGMYITVGFNGSENYLDVSTIKVKIGNDIVDLPDEIVFISSRDEIANGTRLTNIPYDVYKTIGNTRYYLGVKYV